MPYLSINNIKLYYESQGRGEPLVLLHGLGSSTRDWQNQVAFFSKRYQVILVDVRGHGRSDKPPGPYSIPQFAQDLVLFLEALALPPVFLAGLSMGGMIAFQMAVDRPDLVKKLVVVNAGPEYLMNTFKQRIQVWIRFLILRIFGMQKIGELLSKRLFIKPEQEQLRKLFVERWAENDARAYRDSMQAIVGWSVMDLIAKISCPTLILASDEDYTPVSEKQLWTKKLSGGQLGVIKDARHALPVERPQEFNAALESFLKTDS
jgi:pimeloyl-ACP methyl ester carboxylesterase